MEKVRDLLSPEKDNLKLRETKDSAVYIEDVTEYHVDRYEEVLGLLQLANSNRAVAYTKMNAGSSRSHLIFTLEIHQSDNKTNSAKVGKLFMVDLAGCEKVAKTGAKGQTFQEAKKINLSLSA
jgi:kinesin family protein 5